MKKIVIYGTGFLDVIKLIDAINSLEREWEILGFLDGNEKLHGKYLMNYPVLGGKELIPELMQDENVYFFNNRHDELQKFIDRARILESHNCKIPSLIHPSVDLNYVKVGKGCIIPEGCVIGANVEMGDFVAMRYKSLISHDVKVEDFAFIAPGVTVGSDCILKEGCFIGVGSTVLPKITVGKKSYIGAGAVANRHVDDKATVVGIPAKKVKKSITRKLRYHITKRLPFFSFINDLQRLSRSFEK